MNRGGKTGFPVSCLRAVGACCRFSGQQRFIPRPNHL